MLHVNYDVSQMSDYHDLFYCIMIQTELNKFYNFYNVLRGFFFCRWNTSINFYMLLVHLINIVRFCAHNINFQHSNINFQNIHHSQTPDYQRVFSSCKNINPPFHTHEKNLPVTFDSREQTNKIIMEDLNWEVMPTERWITCMCGWPYVLELFLFIHKTNHYACTIVYHVLTVFQFCKQMLLPVKHLYSSWSFLWSSFWRFR